MKLRLEAAALERAGRVVLGPLDLSLDLGAITAVMGHNGAGKSLFLKLIHGLIAPSAGQVTWDGLPAETTRASRGFVFQTPKVMRRSVADNVGFPLVAAGLDRPARQAAVADILARMNLAEFAAQPAATLSGGEGQRMAIARAMVGNPDVILLDEPTASTDPDATAMIEAGILDFTKSGGKVVLVTHDEAQAERLAQRTLRLENGQLKT